MNYNPYPMQEFKSIFYTQSTEIMVQENKLNSLKALTKE